MANIFAIAFGYFELLWKLGMFSEVQDQMTVDVSKILQKEIEEENFSITEELNTKYFQHTFNVSVGGSILLFYSFMFVTTMLMGKEKKQKSITVPFESKSSFDFSWQGN